MLQRLLLSAIVFCLIIFPASAVHAAETGAVKATLSTELERYPTGTQRILAYWENTGSLPLEYGSQWQLEKLVSNRWVVVEKEYTGGAINTFTSAAYILEPGQTRKHVYNVMLFDDAIAEGQYRITSTYTYYRGPGDYDSYAASAPFLITGAASAADSELYCPGLEDYRDITPDALMQSTSARIYRDTASARSVLTNRAEQYQLTPSAAGSGIGSAAYTEINSNQYLFYTYSLGNTPSTLRSYVGVFHLPTNTNYPELVKFDRREIFLTGDYAASVQIYDVSSGVQSTDNSLGAISYENGKFQYKRAY